MNCCLGYRGDSLEEALRLSIQKRISSGDLERYLYLLDELLDDKDISFIASIYFYVERTKYAEIKEYVSLSTNEHTMRRYNYINRILKDMARENFKTVLDILDGKLPFSTERITVISKKAKSEHCTYVRAYLGLVDVETGKWRKQSTMLNSRGTGIKSIPLMTADRDVKSIVYTINAWTDVLKNKNKQIFWDSVSLNIKKQLEASINRLENILKEIKWRIS